MRYIENLELREWVKESLRKAIFQKAHALAVQTGCEILVKLHDVADNKKGFYYATDRLERTYNDKGLHRQPGELPISGETGLPIIPMVDRAIQIQNSCKDVQNDITESSPSDTDSVQESFIDDANTSTQASTDEVSSNQNTPVPMQLSVNTAVTSDSQTDSFASANDASSNIKQEVDKDITVKLEVIEEDTGSLQMTSEQIEADMQTDCVLGQVYEEQSYPTVPMSPKPYQCGMCQKAFRSIQVLQKHTQTFHMRPQNIIASRSRGRGHGGVSKQRQHQFQVPSSPSDQQRFQCMMCSRNFRHPALLEDHMNRSHMSHPSLLSSTQTSFSSSSDTQNSAAIQLPSSQITHSLPNPEPSGSEHLSTSTNSDPSLPKITSVSSLQQFSQNSPAGISETTSASTSAPFTQGSPMAPVYRYPGPGPSGTSQARTQGISPNRVLLEGHTRGRVYNTGMMLPTKRDIMSAILLSASPVNSYRAFKRLGPRHLRNISKQQYTNAARELEQSSVGVIVISQNGGVSFVKKAPGEIQLVLEENYKDLCTYNAYSDRFCLPKPKAVQVNSTLQKKLCELGLRGLVF